VGLRQSRDPRVAQADAQVDAPANAPIRNGSNAFRRGELRLEAELRWHEEFQTNLAIDQEPVT
jgi:hypothetical protein